LKVEKIDLKKIVANMVGKKQYPPKDGGVKTMGTDQGDLIILNEAGVLTFEFCDQRKVIKWNLKEGTMKETTLPTKGAPPAKPTPAKAPAKPPVQGKKPPAVIPPKPTVGKKAAPIAKVDAEEVEPIWVEQMAYNGSEEVVDYNHYSNVITCECGNIRYVKKSDLHQVAKCKPCTRRDRRKRRRLSVKLRKGPTPGSKFIDKQNASRKEQETNSKVKAKAPVAKPPAKPPIKAPAKPPVKPTTKK
jgi:hypothetical protein